MIELESFSAGYPGAEILHNLNLTIHRGEITVLIGPNGCGKSTLLKSIIRSVRKTAGTIRVNGRDYESFPPAELAKSIAYLPQSKTAPDITVGHLVLQGRFPYLRYPRHYTREDRAAALSAMERLGIEALAEAPLKTLSGGTRQKAYIAMALAQQSPAILMDEPISHLDPVHQLRLLDIARELRNQNHAVVLVLHDLPLAMEAADRLVLLQNGTLIDTGTPAEILSRDALHQVLGIRLRAFPTDTGTVYGYER